MCLTEVREQVKPEKYNEKTEFGPFLSEVLHVLSLTLFFILQKALFFFFFNRKWSLYQSDMQYLNILKGAYEQDKSTL